MMQKARCAFQKARRAFVCGRGRGSVALDAGAAAAALFPDGVLQPPDAVDQEGRGAEGEDYLEVEAAQKGLELRPARRSG